ncbi:MAG: Integrase catalytic region, partial [Dehalococcoidia bacterium]|nr:Integrase catalytic region [Dehalococcoidia bacterium]
MQLRRLPRSFYQAGRLSAADLSPKAQERSRWLYAWQVLRAKGLSSAQAGEVLSLPRSTLYRWQRRLQRYGPRGLEPSSRRPRHTRKPTWIPELAQAALNLRELYPRWGKEKLAVLLRREGWQLSVSMVGPILTHLKARGLLREPLLYPVT